MERCEIVYHMSADASIDGIAVHEVADVMYAFAEAVKVLEVPGIDHYVCDVCGETAFDACDMKKLHEQLVRAYRSHKGFLTPGKS